MAETIKGLKRTSYCGDLRLAQKDQAVTLFGWVQRQRDLGALIFIDLRDRTGIVQLALDETTCDPELFQKARSVRSEYVLAVRGTVKERSSKNPDLPTGDIEVDVCELRILNKSETPPFEIAENSATGEATRLKYRYLDLRRPDLQKNIIMRHKIAKTTRDYFDDQGFIEIETPMMIRSTPEGARDFLIPSRVHKGQFYALPQSPQLYKQLSMVAGFDRYVQLARCFRDEDLRADRQPEFTQIDFEMSFVEMDDILEVVEGYIQVLFKTVLDLDIQAPFPRMPYKEAMERYGSDKPDTRFGMELFDISEIVSDCGFGVFENTVKSGGAICGFTAKNAVKTYTRKTIDKLTEHARGIGAKGLAWIRLTEDGIASSFGKFIPEETMQAILQKAGAETGDVVFFVADGVRNKALSILGLLRNTVAAALDIIPEGFHFLWLVEIPFFEYDEELGEYVAMHHPFTSPTDECLDQLEGDKDAVVAKAWDLVLNGVELSSGSIRITDPELQGRIFSMLGLSDEDAHEKFGFLLDAFQYGAPPHGGMGIGLDRLVMQMLGADNLRDVTAYPKLQNMSEPMVESPAAVDAEQLQELGIQITTQED